MLFLSDTISLIFLCRISIWNYPVTKTDTFSLLNWVNQSMFIMSLQTNDILLHVKVMAKSSTLWTHFLTVINVFKHTLPSCVSEHLNPLT